MWVFFFKRKKWIIHWLSLHIISAWKIPQFIYGCHFILTHVFVQMKLTYNIDRMHNTHTTFNSSLSLFFFVSLSSKTGYSRANMIRETDRPDRPMHKYTHAHSSQNLFLATNTYLVHNWIIKCRIFINFIRLPIVIALLMTRLFFLFKIIIF